MAKKKLSDKDIEDIKNDLTEARKILSGRVNPVDATNVRQKALVFVEQALAKVSE